MSVSRCVVRVSRVLLSVAKHYRFPPEGAFSLEGPVHPVVAGPGEYGGQQPTHVQQG